MRRSGVETGPTAARSSRDGVISATRASPGKPRSAAESTRRLRRATLAMLALAALPAVFAVLLVQRERGEVESLGRILDLAGRQRALTERSALLTRHLYYEVDPETHAGYRRRLLDTTNLLEESHEALVFRDGRLGLGGKLSSEAEALLVGPAPAVESRLEDFLSLVRTAAASPPGALRTGNPQLTGLGEKATALNASLERVVKHYDAEVQLAVEGSRQLTMAVGAATLAALVMAWLIVFRRILNRVEAERSATLEHSSVFSCLSDGKQAWVGTADEATIQSVSLRGGAPTVTELATC